MPLGGSLLGGLPVGARWMRHRLRCAFVISSAAASTISGSHTRLAWHDAEVLAVNDECMHADLKGGRVACALSALQQQRRMPAVAAADRRELATTRGVEAKVSTDTFRVMSFNVQFYAQICRVLGDLEQLQIKYGPFKHTGLVKSLQGKSLSALANDLPPLGAGDAGFNAYKALPCVQGNFRAITEFLLAQKPDIVAVQEGCKGLNLTVEGPGYGLKTVVTAGAERHFATKGVLANQVLLNTANPALSMKSTWQMLTKEGGEDGLPKFTDNETGDRDVKRAAAGLRVEVQGQPLDIVSIHLTGGRFDDRRWRQYSEQRFKEVHRVIKERFEPEVPMLILGDFNAPSTEEEVSESYGRSLGAETAEDMAIWKRYMVGVHTELRHIGWTPAYAKDDLPRATSVFGGSVDWVYKSPNWPAGLRVSRPSVPDVIHAADEPWASYPGSGGLRLSLSDHNPVILDISFN